MSPAWPCTVGGFCRLARETIPWRLGAAPGTSARLLENSEQDCPALQAGAFLLHRRFCSLQDAAINDILRTLRT